MGMDFVALMKYGGPGERLSRVLDRLEAGSPAAVQALARRMHERGLGLGREEPAAWEFTSRRELRNRRLARRPGLPNLGVSLWLPEGFSLTFGRDAVELYHLLRWHFFLTEPGLQRAMLEACTCLGRVLGATDCVVTSDFSPVVHAFRDGLGFDASLASAGPEHGERPTLAELYLEIPLPEVMQIVQRPGKPPQTRHREWDLDRPTPEGWQRVTSWDSRGYWRLALGPEFPDPLDAWPQGEEAARRSTSPAVTAPRDEGWWQRCGEPDAMIDHLLKQEDASWRKVRLWACACVRRIWPRLTSEPGRRAVEVAERFADDQADQRSVETAAAAVERVRKGDRRANRAAARLARLCCPARIFPPADVADAVVDAVVGEQDSPEARAAERKMQADLLRDLFGSPFRPVAVEPGWRTQTVVALARAAYEGRELPDGRLDPARLAVLADALEEAGATDADLLAHLRGPGPHVCGCHAVDLLLGKK